MINFPKPADTLAGINKFWFTPADNIGAMGDVINNQLQGLSFTSGNDWLTGFGVYNTRSFSEQKKETAAGIYFARSFKMFYPGFSQAVINQLELMKLRRFIIAFKDNNGLFKIAGTPDNPLNFTYKLRTGKSGSDAQGIEIEFYSNARSRIMSVAGEDIGVI